MKGLLLCNIPKKTLEKVVNDFGFVFWLQKQQQCYIVMLWGVYAKAYLFSGEISEFSGPLRGSLIEKSNFMGLIQAPPLGLPYVTNTVPTTVFKMFLVLNIVVYKRKSFDLDCSVP